MPNQHLIIEPQNELKFHVDFNNLFEPYTTYMSLTNPTNETVLFKIKTTAPKKYCVRPNSGVLEPNARAEIAITPQPVLIDSNEKHKHKFMVQSVVAPEGKTNIDQIWKEISSDQIVDHKLKCILESRFGSPKDAGDNARQNDNTKKRVTAVVSDEVKAVATKVHCTPEQSDSDQQKDASEISLLKEEESKLRHENLHLKEELLRLRQAAAGGDGKGRRQSFRPENKMSLEFIHILIALGMVFIGVVVGKFII